MSEETAPFVQLVHTLSYGDAISGEVLAIKRALDGRGIPNEIAALNVHPKYKQLARTLKSGELPQASFALLHYSLGSPLNELYRSLGCGRGLIFHNLTPSKFFQGVNGRIVRDLMAGEEELRGLLQQCDLVLADSPYNAAEIERFGASAEVLELPIDPDRWSEPANPGIASMLRGSGKKNILHVGRLAPNKAIEDIIRTFYCFHHKIVPDSKLWIVGIDIDTELYSFSLKRLVDELRLDQAVEFTGSLADSELRAMYENCDAYMCMSEHEGFCLPLVEAMHFGLPTLSFASSAIPGTIGGGGILFHEKRYLELALLLKRVVGEAPLRDSLIEAGKKRVQELATFEHFERRLFDLLTPHLVVSESSSGRNAASAEVVAPSRV